MIQRYSCGYGEGLYEDRHGDYVEFKDHEDKITKLEKEKAEMVEYIKTIMPSLEDVLKSAHTNEYYDEKDIIKETYNIIKEKIEDILGDNK